MQFTRAWSVSDRAACLVLVVPDHVPDAADSLSYPHLVHFSLKFSSSTLVKIACLDLIVSLQIMAWFISNIELNGMWTPEVQHGLCQYSRSESWLYRYFRRELLALMRATM